MTRPSLLLVLLAVSLGAAAAVHGGDQHLHARQGGILSPPGTPGPGPTGPTTQPPAGPTSQPPAQPPPDTTRPPTPDPPTDPGTPPTDVTTSPTTTPRTTPTTTLPPPTTTQQAPPPSPTTPISTPSMTLPLSQSMLTTSASVLPGGETVVITLPASVEPTPTETTKAPASSGGLGKGSIIGLSVAGGIAVIAVIAFIIWKLTRKRFADFDDGEEIKWPELNNDNHSHALPVTQTGRAGFETGSDMHGRPDSLADSYGHNAASSTADLYVPGADPYAVPPLPHLNPNQPYRDDPNYPPEYYDPYRGPVPQSFAGGGGAAAGAGEVIPMSDMRARSPGPAVALADGRTTASPGPRGASPGPYAAYGADPRTRNPGPYNAYGP